MNVIARTATVIAAFSLLAGAMAAQADVPGRVGRIAFMDGDVQAYSETDPQWKVAYVNQPITSRNSVFVGDAGRAEISVGSTTLAMDAGSQVDIQQLDDNTFDASVVRGRVSVRVRRLDPNDVYNVAVPGAEFALLRPGRYRIDALPSGSGITVFDGLASVEGDRGPVRIEANSGLRIAGNRSDPHAAPQLLSAAPVSVALDDWVLAREARFRASQAERYVSPNMTGYEDLDANGRWANEVDVGPVWYPTTYVRDDWAPYRYGRWAYVAPWGYTWVDDAPWGFAPFHYGRWVQVGHRWGWAPGAYVQRPVYAPALVGFYGGSGFSASFSVGVGPAVGWYPLAPWQRYSPHYTQNVTYINQVNNITIVNPPRRFEQGDGGRMWNREHGGTLVPQQAFASQRSISSIAIAAPRDVGNRTQAVSVADLPRPAIVPGAARRGPDSGNGGGRPDFRSPSDFASRLGGEAGQRIFDRGARPVAPPTVDGSLPGQDAQRGNGRNGLSPNDQRLPEDRRPALGTEATRAAPQAPVAPLQSDGATVQQRGGPNPPSFNREGGRPQPQSVVPGAVQAQAPARIEGDNRAGRPDRETRNMQPQAPGVDRQQVEVQQRQQVEQQQRQQLELQRQQGEQQRQRQQVELQQRQQAEQQRPQVDQQRQQVELQRQQVEQQRQRQQAEQQQRQQVDLQRQQGEQQRQQVERQQRQQVEQQQRQQVEVQQRQQQQAVQQQPRPQPPPPAPQPRVEPRGPQERPGPAIENRDR